MRHWLILLGKQAPPRLNHCRAQRAAGRAVTGRNESDLLSPRSISNGTSPAAFALARTGCTSSPRTIHAPSPITNSSVAMEFEAGLSKSSRSRVLCCVATGAVGGTVYQIKGANSGSNRRFEPPCIAHDHCTMLAGPGQHNCFGPMALGGLGTLTADLSGVDVPALSAFPGGGEPSTL